MAKSIESIEGIGPKYGAKLRQAEASRRSLKTAARLYRRACDGQVAEGCYGLAELYRSGAGVKQDDRRADDSRAGCEYDADQGDCHGEAPTHYSKKARHVAHEICRDSGTIQPIRSR